MLLAQPFEDFLIEGFVYVGSPAEDPEVIPVWMAHDRVIVILSEIDDPVISGERPEKPDF